MSELERDVQAWSQTVGARARLALGIPLPSSEQDQEEYRAAQRIRRTYSDEWGRGAPSLEQARLEARQAQTLLAYVPPQPETTLALAQRLAQQGIGVNVLSIPPDPNKGLCWKELGPDGREHYVGDPELCERAEAAEELARARFKAGVMDMDLNQPNILRTIA